MLLGFKNLHMKTKKRYFLFSGEKGVVDEYFNGSFKNVIKFIKNEFKEFTEFDVFYCTPDTDLDDLLRFAMSWHEYAEINEKEYKQLKKLKS